MLMVLKLCVTALVLVSGAGAQESICHVSMLMAQSTPQILTSETLATVGPEPLMCAVHMTVSDGFSLKLNFTSIEEGIALDIFRMDPSINQPIYVGVESNLVGPNPPIYVFPGSVYVCFSLIISPKTEFTMEYQEVAFEENICTMMPLVLADTTVREIVTPNFGNGPYFDNEMCQVTIQSNVTGASEVKVEVTNFDMDCPFDTIKICDGVDCYDLCDTNQRNFSGNNMTVTFSSDFITAFAGMRLEYIAVSEFSDWTPWVSMGCCEYRNCQMFVKDTRTRNCLIDTCQDELVQDRTRVCSRKCADCLLR